MSASLFSHQFPPMSPETLEKILGYLPEPTDVEVKLYGFDCSDISRQLKEVIEGLEVDAHQYPIDWIYQLKNASKAKVLEIYRKSGLPMEGSRASPPELDREETDALILEIQGYLRRVALHKVYWEQDNVKIELTPDRMKIEYSGQEPDYISRMRRELAPQTTINLFL